MMSDPKDPDVCVEDLDDYSITPLPPDVVRDAIKNTPTHKRLVHTEAKLLVSLGFWVLPVARLEKGFPEKEFNANSASNSSKRIDEWFHPESSRFAGWNLAIACGRKGDIGLVIADADRHGRGDGVQEWNDLVAENTDPGLHPWATTPNKGEHHLFQWHLAFTKKSTKSASDSGLEILGGKHGSFTSFALVYPSVVKDRSGDHKQYEWQIHPKDCRPPPTPDWLVASIGATKQQPMSGGRGNENVVEADLEQVIPQDQIKSMLAVIDPNELSYSEWLTIGMAINSQHQDAVQIWDDWSQQGDRYKHGECESRWRGFTAVGLKARVTIGTLFYHASKFDWKPAENDTFCDSVSLAVAKLNRTYSYVVVGGHDRILRRLPDHGEGQLHYDLLAPSAFRRLFPGEIIKNRNWSKAKKLPDAWLDSPYRRSYPYGLMLCPNGDVPPGVFNTWNGFAYEPIEGDCSLFLAHVRDVVCDGDDDLYTWLLDWAADCVQDPTDLKGTAVVMRGKEGTGKGTFGNTIGKLFGAHYVHLIDASHLMGNFNAHLIDAVVVFADEITWGGNVKNQGKLKGLVTEHRLIGERKGVDAVTYRNYAHVIIASNAEWVVPAGGSSRRWFVLDVNDTKANDRRHFDAIHHQLVNGGYEALLHQLQNRKITSDLRLAPVTNALADQRRLSTASRDKFYDYLDQRLGENAWDQTAFIEHADYGWCLVKNFIYVDYCHFTEKLRGIPWSDTRFWKQWLSVFPYARGNQKDWPRTRIHKHVTRVAVLKSRQQMCADFAIHYGTASDEVKAAKTDWLQEDKGI